MWYFALRVTPSLAGLDGAWVRVLRDSEGVWAESGGGSEAALLYELAEESVSLWEAWRGGECECEFEFECEFEPELEPGQEDGVDTACLGAVLGAFVLYLGWERERLI